MLKYRQATRDELRNEFLLSCLRAAKLDQKQGREYLRPKTIRTIQKHQAKFAACLEAVESHKAAYRITVAKAKEANKQLQWHLRDFWDDLKRQASRDQVSTAILQTYELNERGAKPHIKGGREGWILMTARVLANDKYAQDLGFSGMWNREQVEKALAGARKAELAVLSADKELNEERGELQALRREIILFSRDVANELRHMLRREPAQFRRNVMRSYGVQFVGDSSAESPTNSDEATTIPESAEPTAAHRMPINQGEAQPASLPEPQITPISEYSNGTTPQPMA